MDSGYIREGDKVIKRPIEATNIAIDLGSWFTVHSSSNYTVDLEDILHMCQTLKELGYDVIKHVVDGKYIDILIKGKE